MQGTTTASGTVINAAAPLDRTFHAEVETSPQSRPAMIVPTGGGAGVGLPANALAKRQAARSGSTTTNAGALSPSLFEKCAHTAAASPPTPPWTKTCDSCSSAGNCCKTSSTKIV